MIRRSLRDLIIIEELDDTNSNSSGLEEVRNGSGADQVSLARQGDCLSGVAPGGGREGAWRVCSGGSVITWDGLEMGE